MKKNELKFKTAALTLDRRDEIVAALKEREFVLLDEEGDKTYLFVSDGTVALALMAETFIGSEEPEVTCQQALDLITQVEPNPEQGFVEFPVGDDAMFGATWNSGESHRYFYWTDVASTECESDLGLVFAGWVWEDVDGRLISTNRQGVDAEGRLVVADLTWTKPAQPVAVRFWRKNK